MKEIKLQFNISNYSPNDFELPNGKYDLKYSIIQSTGNKFDKFFVSEGDRFIILKFYWKKDDPIISDDILANPINNIIKPKKAYKIFRFNLKIEYPRTEQVEIEYEMEIKFKIN